MRVYKPYYIENTKFTHRARVALALCKGGVHEPFILEKVWFQSTKGHIIEPLFGVHICSYMLYRIP